MENDGQCLVAACVSEHFVMYSFNNFRILVLWFEILNFIIVGRVLFNCEFDVCAVDETIIGRVHENVVSVVYGYEN